MSCRKSRPPCLTEKSLSPEEQQAKINDVRRMLGPKADKLPVLCSDESIIRYLIARNWNTKKATKMLAESLKWRLQYKPENIRWEEIAKEAETGKIYRADYYDKCGRTVLILRPGFQNTKSTESQIKYLVYCMENAIMHLNPEKGQMVWLIDFQGWTMSSISIKVTRETANVLQNHYPERLGLAILYNPPKVFESFWALVKPFLEPKTYKKVRFAYSDDTQSQKIMEALFDVDKLESAFGGKNTAGFNYEAYAKRMREDDAKKSGSMNSGSSVPITQSSVAAQSHEVSEQWSESLAPDPSSESSDESELSSFDEPAAKVECIDSKADVLTLNSEDDAKIEAAEPKLQS
ncbi:phosphatidylinositol transfer protein 3-like isoform X2 [Mangifera indica]|uniref:phosphatidylinositol transfer protein 3-like isoform X2 n=1 Tax=Mangifera indica TaxID=29780 RepID=UPI001CFACF9F|nr:phosphatidylinositol transfer protein 3-like isoform X2 [Mangifera indica]